MHSARDRITLRDDNNAKYELPITNQRNGLDCVNVSFIKPETHIPSSFNMVQINDALAAHERLLHACPQMINKTSASNEIINMPYISSSSINCPTCLTCKMTKYQPASSKVKKSEHKTAQCSVAPPTIKRVTLRMPNASPSPISPSSTTTSPNAKILPLSIRSLMSLTTPDAIYPPGALLHLDFSFYPVTSVRGFTSVLDVLCASTSYPWAFPTRSKRSPVSIVLWMICVINKQIKTFHRMRVDEDGALARSSEFLKTIFI